MEARVIGIKIHARAHEYAAALQAHGTISSRVCLELKNKLMA